MKLTDIIQNGHNIKQEDITGFKLIGLNIPVTLIVIMEIVANVCNVDFSIMGTKYRGRELSMARFIYFYFAIKYNKWSYEEIGGKVNRDHASVTYGIGKVVDFLEFDKVIIDNVNKVSEMLNR